VERLVEAVKELGSRPNRESARKCKSACTVEAVIVSLGPRDGCKCRESACRGPKMSTDAVQVY
jgi:hypothetical protein